MDVDVDDNDDIDDFCRSPTVSFADDPGGRLGGGVGGTQRWWRDGWKEEEWTTTTTTTTNAVEACTSPCACPPGKA